MAIAFREKLAKRAKKAEIFVPDALLSPLQAYFELLRKWNRSVSLTALPVEAVGDEALDRLIIEPLVAAQHLPSRVEAIIDVGSGGGSPAIPLKVARPDVSLRMVESKSRKAAFLREAVRQLELTNTCVEAVRLESLLARPEFQESADVATMRAVKLEQSVFDALQALLKPGGLVFLFQARHFKVNPLPPFALRQTVPLVEATHSELAVLVKNVMFHVEQKD